MESTEASGPASSASSKPKISYACEACRAAKVKCEEGTAEGICRRCSVTKRECITKTGPRTRRRKVKLHTAVSRSTPPPCAPSKTFTIDVPLSTENGVDGEPSTVFDVLRDAHDGILDNLILEDDDAVEGSRTTLTTATPVSAGSRAFSTPSQSASSRIHNLSSLKPQFNLDSATSLLASFCDGMLPYFPIIILPPNASVHTLGRERPFILLAILAAASAGKRLNGHNLYDDEFRKVLGLKFVSDGERSLELLDGLLIYCAWFPLHLRPKNKLALQYVRMANDLVDDLELDRPKDDNYLAGIRTDQEHADAVRTYLAAQLISSSFSTTWHKKNDTLPFQNWTAACCDMFADKQSAASDQSLAWLVRLQRLVSETARLAQCDGENHLEVQRDLLLIKGLKSQFLEFQGDMSLDVSSQPAIRMASLATELILHASPLLKFPYYKTQRGDTLGTPPLAVAQTNSNTLIPCTALLHTWFDHILSLPAAEFSHLTSIGWSHLVTSVIIGLRLSFPIPGAKCHNWDHAKARQTLDFHRFLTRFAAIGGTSSQLSDPAPPSCSHIRTTTTATDVLSASKIVVDVVRRKYEKRLAALETAEMASMQSAPPLPGLDQSVYKCPMLDGSLGQYIQQWDETLIDNPDFTVSALDGAEMDTHPEAWGYSDDLWTRMTTGWTQDEFYPMDFDVTL